jgi:hypothetical protein
VTDVKHVIEIDEDVDNDRAYWQCDCGHAGSASSDRVDLAAEKRIPEGDRVAYRYRGGRS